MEGSLWCDFSISPSPVRSQDGDISLYIVRIFSNLSVPMAPLFFRDLPKEAFDMPILRSNAATEMPFLSKYSFILSTIIGYYL